MFNRSSLIRQAVLVPLLVTVTACGGGGSDDDDDTVAEGGVLFSGTVRADLPADTSSAIPGVTVCALGNCDTTEDDGEWSFSVPNSSYAGGAVLFDLNGSTIDTTATVQGLNPASQTIDIDFIVEDGNSVSVGNVSQDSTPAPGPTPAPTPEPEGPLSTDPSERACQILERSNITITDVSTPIVHSAAEGCPEEIQTLIAVGNNHSIPYEYEVVVDVADITVDPVVATAGQGDLNRHRGTYLCTRTESFVANISARVTRYFPAEGEVITTADAINRCGRNANVGNTEDTKQISVQVQP